MQIEFFVPGIPRPGGSKRHVGGGRLIEAGKHTAGWRATVAGFGLQHAPDELLDGPLGLNLTFTMPRPKAHYKGRSGRLRASAPHWHTNRPDATKLCRAVEDALSGVLWRDDAFISWQQVEKRYGPRPGVVVSVRKLSP